MWEDVFPMESEIRARGHNYTRDLSNTPRFNTFYSRTFHTIISILAFLTTRILVAAHCQLTQHDLNISTTARTVTASQQVNHRHNEAVKVRNIKSDTSPAKDGNTF